MLGLLGLVSLTNSSLIIQERVLGEEASGRCRQRRCQLYYRAVHCGESGKYEFHESIVKYAEISGRIRTSDALPPLRCLGLPTTAFQEVSMTIDFQLVKK